MFIIDFIVKHLVHNLVKLLGSDVFCEFMRGISLYVVCGRLDEQLELMLIDVCIN